MLKNSQSRYHTLGLFLLIVRPTLYVKYSVIIELQNKIKNSKLIVFENTKHNLLVGKNNEKLINIIKKEIK